MSPHQAQNSNFYYGNTSEFESLEIQTRNSGNLGPRYYSNVDPDNSSITYDPNNNGDIMNMSGQSSFVEVIHLDYKKRKNRPSNEFSQLDVKNKYKYHFN